MSSETTRLGRNFDDLADKFTQNIYGSPKGQIRHKILWRDLDPILTQSRESPLTFLDVGGGEGRIACELALQGHHIIMCDLSANMLAKARQLATEKGVLDQIQFVHCPLQQLGDYLTQPVDVILFHAVLEWLPEQPQALALLKSYLKPNGILSLLYYNYYGLLMRNMMLGNFGYVNIGMYKKKKRTLSPDFPVKPEEVDQWLKVLGFIVRSKRGIRVFYDYIENKTKREKAFDELLELEEKFSDSAPFIHLARYIHIVAENR